MPFKLVQVNAMMLASMADVAKFIQTGAGRVALVPHE